MIVTQGNALFNNGGVSWNISVVGTGDWAGLYGYGGRLVDDIAYYGGVEYVLPSVIPAPGSWVPLGSGNITKGANYVIVVNMSSYDPVRRGDTILIGKETLVTRGGPTSQAPNWGVMDLSPLLDTRYYR